MKKVLLILMIMLLAFAAGCNTAPKDVPEQKTQPSQATVSMAPVVVTYVSPSKEETKKTKPTKTKVTTELDGTIMHERENIVYCEEVSDNSIEDNCFTNPDYVVAVASKSPNFCQSLDDNYRKSECLTYLQEGYGVNE
ncbi:hypothetical protein HYY69_00835 [Candidatus Woesearchaeota archaeon]|nr:hypothetical protein [Candidatus Woesearchaeota archaeon]